jgi:hypothetical protein
MVDIDVTPQIRRGLETLFRDLKRHAVRTARKQAKLVVIEMASNPSSSMPPLGGDVTGPLAANTVTRLLGRLLSLVAPTEGQVLKYISGVWTPANEATGAGHAVYDETTALTQRSKLRFLGLGVTATDNPGADATDVTIPGTDVYATDTELAAAIAAHEAAADPHPQYTTAAELSAALTSYILKSAFTAKGDLLAGTGPGTFSVLAAPATTGYYLRTDPTALTGLRWVPVPDGLIDFVIDGTDFVIDGTDSVVAE